jgi:hypothetical protein
LTDFFGLFNAEFAAAKYNLRVKELACFCEAVNPYGGTQGECNLPISPIILNLDGDVKNDVLALGDSGSYFDMNAWGVANKTGWVSPTDGLLVSDFNNNGQIDDIDELFGNKSYKNGFEQLQAQFDSNNDGTIDNNDEKFSELQIWIDANGDGISQDGELKSLEELGIASINLNHTVVNGKQGGEIIAAGTYTKEDGSTGEATDYLFDVSMKYSVYRGDYVITEEIMNVFPNFNGYGAFKDLHIAMTLDESLYTFVRDKMTDLDEIDANFDEFMLKWSGLEAKHKSLGIDTDGKLRFVDMIWILTQRNGDPAITDAELIAGETNACYIEHDNTAIYGDLKNRYIAIMGSAEQKR